jgi:hypothetical protein
VDSAIGLAVTCDMSEVATDSGLPLNMSMPRAAENLAAEEGGAGRADSTEPHSGEPNDGWFMAILWCSSRLCSWSASLVVLMESVEGEPPIRSAQSLSGDVCWGLSDCKVGETSGIAGAECMLMMDSGESFTELALNVDGVEDTLAGSSVTRGPPTESLKVTVADGLVVGITTGVGGIDATVGVPTAEDMIGMGVAEVRTDGVLIQEPEL